jgi:hypothetical protein
MTIAIERRHEFVAVPGRSGRKFLGARDLEPNAFEGMRQLSGRRFGHGL